MRLGRIGAALLTFVAATTLGVSSPPAGAIFNGTSPAITEAPWSVRILNGTGICSGSIVSRHLILTASHCIGGTGAYSIKNAYLNITGLDVRWNSGWVCNNTSQPDLALLHTNTDLSTIAGIRPLPLAPTTAVDSAQAGLGVTLFGWGRTDDLAKAKYTPGTQCNGTYNKPPKLPTTVRKTKDGSYKLTSCGRALIFPGEICFAQMGSSPSRVQNGDSGAAWVAWYGDTWLGIGVNHGSEGLTLSDAVSVAAQRSAILANSVGDIFSPAPNTIVREASSGAAWLVGADRFRRWIPTPAIYNCLVAAGSPISPVTNSFEIKTIPEKTKEQVSCTPPPATTTTTTVPSGTYSETVGIATNTWTNYTNAGGTQGPTIPAFTTVQIACKLQGFRVADGNTWWYRIAQSPWSNQYYASADAFYNNGATSGSLIGTPFVDTAVRDC